MKNYFGKGHVSEKWPKIAQKSPKKAQNSKKTKKAPKKLKKPKKAEKAHNLKIGKIAQKSPNFFGSFSSGLFKTNFGVHGHFFLLRQ